MTTVHFRFQSESLKIDLVAFYIFFNIQRRTATSADNETYRAVQSLYVNCKIKAEFQLKLAKSVCLMLLSSKNNESDGIKTFEVYSSYITLASNIFKQTKTLICVMVYIVEKV